jgi:hypothetical protein
MNNSTSFTRSLGFAESAFSNRGGGGGTVSRFISKLPSAPSLSLSLSGPAEPTKKLLIIIGYLLFGFVVFAIILYTVNAFYPYWDLYGLRTPFGPAYKSQRYWTNITIPANSEPPSGLYITPEESITKRPAAYTLMLDLYIQSSKAPMMGSFRHIIHRGSDDYNQLAQSTAATGIVGNVSSDRSFEASSASAERVKGIPLPNFMNPGIFLHPFRNDLIFFFQTEAAQKRVIGYDVLYLESLALDDIPLLEWFRVIVVMNGSVVDIYKNGELMRSIILKGDPRSVSNQWFGRSGPAPVAGIVQNLKLWDGPLNPEQVKKAASIAFPSKPVLKGTMAGCEI